MTAEEIFAEVTKKVAAAESALREASDLLRLDFEEFLTREQARERIKMRNSIRNAKLALSEGLL